METVPGVGPAALGPAGAGWILEGGAGSVNPVVTGSPRTKATLWLVRWDSN